MRLLCWCLGLVSVMFADATRPLRWTFEDATTGALPPGWTPAKTGDGPGSLWKVVEDSSAPKLKTLGKVEVGKAPKRVAFVP